MGLAQKIGGFTGFPLSAYYQLSNLFCTPHVRELLSQ